MVNDLLIDREQCISNQVIRPATKQRVLPKMSEACNAHPTTPHAYMFTN